MPIQKPLVLAGAVLGLVPIALGIAALVTKVWLKLGPITSSLVICDSSVTCPSGSTYDAAKGLEIAGVCVTGIGVIVAVIIGLFMKNRLLKLIPVVLLIIGPVLIFIGLLLYAKVALQRALGGTASVEIGYSLSLMVVACIVGFVLAAHFAYIAGLREGEQRTVTQERVFVRESVLF